MVLSGAGADGTSDPRLVYRATCDQGAGRGTEIVAAQSSTQRLVVSHEAGLIDVFDLGVPGRPERAAQHRIPLEPGGVVTCVSVHPGCDHALAAVRAAGPVERGKVVFLDLSTGAILHVVLVGVGPDDLAVSPDGRFAVVANGAEQLAWDPVTRSYASAPGSTSTGTGGSPSSRRT